MSEHARTRAVRAGINTDPAFGAVVPPIHLSTNYAFAGLGHTPEFDYSRSGNPTRAMLGAAIGDLEGGAPAVITASGMAAITTVLLGLLPVAGTVLAPIDCYGGTWRLLDALARTGRLQVRFVDFSDLAAVEADLPGADLLWVESPTNPLLHLADLKQIGVLAAQVGALFVVDNTFATPVVQRPIEFGADIVVHSATKYLNGHSDVVAGAIIAADPERATELGWWANTLGTTSGALDSYLVLRGLRTLHLRMAAAQANAAAVAGLLIDHPAVRAVHFPGLAGHPQHELALRQQQGFGAMVSFELADLAAAQRFLDGLKHFCLAESLGGVESLIAHPASMTHAAMPEAVREAGGISDGLLRLSLGVEDTDDIVNDIRAGLDRALAD